MHRHVQAFAAKPASVQSMLLRMVSANQASESRARPGLMLQRSLKLIKQRVLKSGRTQAEMAWLKHNQAALCDFLTISPGSSP